MRARNIKPGFWKNETLGTLDPFVGLTFIGLWGLADCDGRLEDRPLRIKAELYPYRESRDVNGDLTVLQRHGFIYRYQVKDKSYIQIINFKLHQNPHHTERSLNLPCFIDGRDVTVTSPLSNVSLTVTAGMNHESCNLNHVFMNHDSGGENSKSQEPEKPIATDAVCPADSVPLFKFILDDQSEWEPELELLQKLSDTYQNIPDIDEEIKKASAWCFANPSKRKTRRGMPKFLNNWLSKANATNQPIQKKRPLTDYEIRHGWYSGQTGMTFDVIECDDPDCRCHKKEKAK